MKQLLVHAGVLVLSAALAYSVWARDEVVPEKEQTTVEVWGGSPASVSRLSFDGKTRKLRLEAKTDEAGRYYVGIVDKEDPPKTDDPHAGLENHPGVPKPEEPKGETKKQTIRFVSVKAGEDLVKGLAPLKALRAVGKVEGGRGEEFGFDKPEGTLKVTLDGKEHVLVIGGSTPGGSERYAKYQATGEVFAIPGEISQSLMFSDSRLPERELHGFKPDEVTKVIIRKGNKTRELARMKEKKDGWADFAQPTKQDETAGNWMSKVGRLRGSEFIETPQVPVKPEDAIVRIEYFEGSKRLGHLELYKQPGEKGNDYLARTAWGRWFVKVPTTTAEQVEQDLGSVLK
jgi:hypothetical protein